MKRSKTVLWSVCSGSCCKGQNYKEEDHFNLLFLIGEGGTLIWNNLATTTNSFITCLPI